MRKLLGALVAVTFVAAMAAPAFAKDMTIKGELVDQACYLKDKKAGPDHKECAQSCAKRGQQVALLTADGKLCEVMGDLAADKNAKLVNHMSHIVELTGDVSEKDGKMIITATDLKMAK